MRDCYYLIAKIRTSISKRYLNMLMLVTIKFLRTKVQLLGKGKFQQKVIFSGQGKISIGENFSFGYRYGGGHAGALCEIQARTKESSIVIGRNLSTNNGVYICSAKNITIGDDCLMGEGVIIMDHDGHGIHPKERRTSNGRISSVLIGNNAWIGSRAIILPGTVLGDNCVVGAGAIVKGIFESDCIIAGNPGRVIKSVINE